MNRRIKGLLSMLVSILMLALLAVPVTAFAAVEPGAPTSVTAAATANNGEITVTIKAPANAGDNATIAAYKIEVYKGSTYIGYEQPAATGDKTHTIAGLEDATTYTFKVYAINVDNGGVSHQSTDSLSATATTKAAATAPPAPSTPGEPGVNLTAGNGYILVYLTAPGNASSAGALTYNIKVKSGSSVVYNNDVSLAAGYWVTGLNNGTTYTVEVYAKNSAGSSATVSKTATPSATSLTAPDAPGVTLTPGNGYIDVNITKPANIGSGSSSVTYYIDVKQSGSTRNYSTSSTGTYRVSGLTNNVQCTVEVYARNNNNLSSAVVSKTATPGASVSYALVSQSGTWTGSGTIYFLIDAPYSAFSSFAVNGYTLTRNSHYTAESADSNRTRITVYAGYLNTLANGSHTINAVFTGGNCNASFSVSKTVSPTPAPPTSSKGNYMVTATSLNVRSAASTSASIVGRLTRGTIVTVEQIIGNWGKITMSNGLGGWISMSYVSATSSSVAPPSGGAIGAYITTGNVNMRSGPGTNYLSLGVLARGTRVNVISFTGNWAYATVGNRNVYISRTYLRLY